MLPVLNRDSWIPSVFADFFDTDFMPRTRATAPAINVKETDKAYTVELAAPGLKKDDFEVNVDADGNLHIKMESKAEHKDEDNKMVPVHEVGWGSATDTPTHLVLQFDSSHGGAYVGTVGNTLWIDNVELVY